MTETPDSLIADSMRVVEQIENGACRCHDEPHLNLLHDIASDLVEWGKRQSPGLALPPGWREALANEAARTLGDLPDSMRPMRERPRYEPTP